MKHLKCFLIVPLVTCLANLSFAEHCSICIIDTCETTYPTYGDGDGDGMNDGLEVALASQFHPVLYLDNANSELPYFMPGYYSTPFYSDDSPGHNAPPDVVSNGTVYYRVHPFGIVASGRCRYIEIDYWFYFIYNRAECANGNHAEHGHDWEHIAMALVGNPGEYRAASIWYAQHYGGEYVDPDEAPWLGTPQESGVRVYIVDGSHASYPSTGQRCAVWVWIGWWWCFCYENPNGQWSFEDVILAPLWELYDSRRPLWLDYSERWPGLSTYISSIGEHFYPPYGPAWGTHQQTWLIGHFGGEIPFCEVSWKEDIPEPQYFQVSNFRDGHQLTNALYLTWEDPLRWSAERICPTTMPCA